MESIYESQQDLISDDIFLKPAEYAGFWIRFAAAMIDGIVLGIFNYVLGLATGISTTGLTLEDGNFWQMLGMSYSISTGVGILYYAFMESSTWQATLGKRAVSLKVTDLYGNRISFARAFGRYFAKLVSAIILCIGYIMAAFTEKKQALHDIMAGTLVVRG